ncbi:MAG: prephenate dehydrogenase [Actinomycetales bacterium]
MSLPETVAEPPAGLPGAVRVVGAGLLGTSLGLALRQQGVDVELSDPSPTALALAADLGAGRPASPAAPGGAALVVVAAPPDVVAEVVAAELAAAPDAVVTDLASVKAGPLKALQDKGIELSRYVGSHPMAGRERSGAVAARADLFAGRPWVVCAHPASSAAALAAVRSLAVTVGALPTELDADAHDGAVALVSHVPQVLASLAAARLSRASEGALALSGQGLRDVTRIAASDPALWTQILGANAAAVGDVLRAVRADLDRVVEALEALAAETAETPARGARAAVAGLVAQGNAGERRIPGKHGAPHTSYAVVPVLVPDRPGELARLLHDVGAAGVNLEDLRLEHSQGQPVGVAEVLVVPAAAPTLVSALQERGWTVHEAGRTL